MDDINEIEAAPVLLPEPIINEFQARLNVTWNGQNGDMPDPVDFDAPDQQIVMWAQEAIQGGGIPGIAADPTADLRDFVIDRFPAGEEITYNRLMLRPKTPFGC